MIKNKDTKKTFQDIVAEFISSKKTVILVIIGIILAFLLFFAVYSEIEKNINEQSAILAEDAQKKYDSWLNEENKENKDELENELLELIDKIINEYPDKYAALRAYYLKGLISYNKENWQDAYGNFILLKDDFRGSYLTSLALFLAGVCQEELNNSELAIEAYTEIYNNYKNMPLLPDVIFSIGRLYDNDGNYEKAEEYYNILKADYGSSLWTKYAINRIIYLKSIGKL
jgi:TolA-binding protein